ncbi:MAG TPA: ATP-binding protein [Vicinamibacterales bacterium]|nr:ATP-binding protein [Vicinamibacterales bacterium]
MRTNAATLPVLRPIRVYLLILVLGAMLPGALLTGVLVWRAFDSNRTVTERRLLDSARVDASALDREFTSIVSILEALATSPALDHDDLEAFHQEGSRVHATQSGWYSIVLISPDGQQLVSTRVAWGTPLSRVSEPESLKQLVQNEEPVVGAITRAQPGGAEILFSVRVPVLRQGILRYALSAIVNVEALERVVPPRAPDSEEWTRTLLDPAGTIAVRTRGAENYVGNPAPDAFRALIRDVSETVSSQKTREGLPVYAATSRGKYGWTAVVVVTQETLDAPLRASMKAMLIGGGLLMLCGLAAVLRVSRRLRVDLAAATTAAEAVAEGRPLPRANPHVAETQRLQRSLATTASLLERRARERDEEIRRTDAARTEAEEANRTKDQFLAVLGHELRNPLAPAVTALELMKMRDPKVFTREREVLERQIAHMARLVNDLLDVSRLARGKVKLDRRRFELREAVDRAVDMARPLIAQHQHSLQLSVPGSGLMVDGDLDRLVQVFSNLLTNAARYTPPGGHIAVVATASGDRVVIACEDDGPGVPPELAPNLFAPFAQGPRALDRREGGLGLGLALARMFTELHGGTIQVEQRPDVGGSRFVVMLPLAPTDAAAAAAEPARTAQVVPPRKILVVDDNADACEMLRSALVHAGHAVEVAGNGPDAIAIADGFRPDVGVLDIGLPGMNGYELARRLRRSHTRIRLIALTGYGQIGDVDAATAAGFDAHCAKPVTTTALLEHIQSAQLS